jgi:pimeloyl-ACP methyl ester carboxylesterase
MISGRLLLLLMLVVPAEASSAAERTGMLAGLSVAVWDDGAAGPRPIVIFSHGFHGCATQSRFLMSALAADGYLVVAPNHRDAICDGNMARRREPPEMPLRFPAEWSDTTYRDRADDIRRLIAALHVDAALAPRIDWRRLALAGHSLGGYTVLALAGAWPSWRLEGVKAVLAMAPYSQPFVLRRTLAGLSAPVMYQSGTLDLGITPALTRPAGAYDLSPAPKFLVDFSGAAHLAWTNSGLIAHAQIVEYGCAFLDRYVKGEGARPALTNPAPGVALLRFETR